MTEIIIGAGASGLACAIRLKQNMPNDEVILLERLDTLGKKILAAWETADATFQTSMQSIIER